MAASSARSPPERRRAARSRAATASSSSPPASGAFRSSRRTRLASVGSGDAEPADRLVGLGDVAGDLLGPHHLLAAVGKRVFLAGLGREPVEFVDRGAEILRLGLGGGDAALEARQPRDTASRQAR